ncbi:MAG: uncharacterized protein QOJ47_1662 [Gaiellales bacterium]|nr:uncharacterized protein [Gaiellales bacterium]
MAGRHGDGWRLRVAAPPEDGRANQAVERLLARTLGVHTRDVRIVRGHGARDKVIEIDGLDAPQVERALEAAAERGA